LVADEKVMPERAALLRSANLDLKEISRLLEGIHRNEVAGFLAEAYRKLPEEYKVGLPESASRTLADSQRILERESRLVDVEVVVSAAAGADHLSWSCAAQ
jgi:hypothetical protein